MSAGHKIVMTPPCAWNSRTPAAGNRFLVLSHDIDDVSAVLEVVGQEVVGLLGRAGAQQFLAVEGAEFAGVFDPHCIRWATSTSCCAVLVMSNTTHVPSRRSGGERRWGGQTRVVDVFAGG